MHKHFPFSSSAHQQTSNIQYMYKKSWHWNRYSILHQPKSSKSMSTESFDPFLNTKNVWHWGSGENKSRNGENESKFRIAIIEYL